LLQSVDRKSIFWLVCWLGSNSVILSECLNSNLNIAHFRFKKAQGRQIDSTLKINCAWLFCQFNRLQSTGQIPEWLCCQLEGNEWLKVSNNVADSKNTTSNEKYLLDWAVPCASDSTVKEGEVDDFQHYCRYSACWNVMYGQHMSRTMKQRFYTHSGVFSHE